MELPILWLILSAALALYGANSKLAFWKIFFLSLVLSPVVGLVLVIHLQRKAAVSARYVSKADKLIRYDNVPEAISYLNPALDLQRDPEILYKLAVCYSLMKNNYRAYMHLRQALDLGLKHPERTGTDPLLSWFRDQPEFKEFKGQVSREMEKEALENFRLHERADPERMIRKNETRDTTRGLLRT